MRYDREQQNSGDGQTEEDLREIEGYKAYADIYEEEWERSLFIYQKIIPSFLSTSEGKKYFSEYDEEDCGMSD